MSAAAAAASREEIAAARRSMFRRLFDYVKRNRRDYLIGLVTTLGYVGGFIAVPMLVGWSVKAIAEGLPAGEVGRRCAWLAGVVVVRSGLRFVSRVLVFNAAREVEYQLRNDLFAALQAQPQSFFHEWRTGDLMSRAVNDLTSVRLMLGPGLLSVAQTPILFVAAFGAFVLSNDIRAPQVEQAASDRYSVNSVVITRQHEFIKR